jgi:hypothetical protein
VQGDQGKEGQEKIQAHDVAELPSTKADSGTFYCVSPTTYFHRYIIACPSAGTDCAS